MKFLSKRVLQTEPNTSELNRTIAALAHVQGHVFSTVVESIRIGMSTADVADVAREAAKNQGVQFFFREKFGFPDDISICLNDEVMNGIPSTARLLKQGDMLKIAFGLHEKMKAFTTQTWTVHMGDADGERGKFLRDAQDSLSTAVENCVVGAALSAISGRMRSDVTQRGAVLSRDFAGHLIGTEPVMEPQIVERTGLFTPEFSLSEGTILSLLTLIHPSEPRLGQRADNWTVYDKNRALSACYSHLVRVTNGKPEVLTSVHPVIIYS
jgi:methionyl aminopeptidase